MCPVPTPTLMLALLLLSLPQHLHELENKASLTSAARPSLGLPPKCFRPSGFAPLPPVLVCPLKTWPCLLSECGISDQEKVILWSPQNWFEGDYFFGVTKEITFLKSNNLTFGGIKACSLFKLGSTQLGAGRPL